MWTRQYKRSKLRVVVVPVLACCLLGYFVFHAVNGTLGLNSSERYDSQMSELKVELASLEKRRAEMQTRTKLLSDGSLERDLIDETARRSLGLTRSNELIMLHSSN